MFLIYIYIYIYYVGHSASDIFHGVSAYLVPRYFGNSSAFFVSFLSVNQQAFHFGLMSSRVKENPANKS